MCPTTSSAARTPRQSRICPSLSRRRRSPPCSTRRRAWWSRRVRGNTSSRLLNSASTCPTKHSERTRPGLMTAAFESQSHNSRGHCLDFICCPEGFKSPHLELSTSGSGVITVISGFRILMLVLTPCPTLSRIKSWNQNKRQDRFVFFTCRWSLTVLLTPDFTHCEDGHFGANWPQKCLEWDVKIWLCALGLTRRWIKDDARLAFCDGDHWRDSSSDLGSVHSCCSCSHFLPRTTQSPK